ncbi:MAG: gamma-glutamyltransferase [Proteobacteria bacterium]|nr:gamma-glutamyltransferase [Pseudomonadota bacterium]
MEGVISAPEPEAVEAGAEMLRAGGNAMDAAIACAFVQGVVDPPMTGIGGWGTLQVFMAKPAAHATVDFYATAPRAARADMWTDKLVGQTRDGWGFLIANHENEIGYKAIATPGSLKGYAEAHAKFGVLPWAQLLEPAIALAEGGFRLLPHFHQFLVGPSVMGRAAPRDKMRFSATGRRLYYQEDGDAKAVGTVLKNPELGRSLRRIAEHGADIFYQGAMAEEIIADIQAHGGILTREDLAEYRPRWSEPNWTTYRGRRISSNQPPGGGIVLLELLNILENFDIAALGHNTPDYIRTVGEAMKCAMADKDQLVGDPEFVDVPIARFLDKAYAASVAEKIRKGERYSVTRLNGSEGKHTTNVSVLDADGNAVVMTHSLGMVSGAATEGLGFFYNGAMGVFDPRPGHAGSIAPGKRRYTSACPTLVFEGDTPSMVVGAPGGAHIVNAVLQSLLNVIDFGMPMSEAVSAPRFSVTSDKIDISNRIPHRVSNALAADGYEIVRSHKSYVFADVHAVGRTKHGWTGGADPSADGMVMVA